MASETMRRLDEIVGSFREGVIVRVSCGGMLCGECIQCTARAAKASLQREQRAAQDEIARLTAELDAAKEREKEYRHVLILLTSDEEAGIASTEYGEHCVYCFRESADLDPALLHEDDCPVKAGRRALAAGLE